MRKIFAVAGIIGALGIASVAFAQTTLPEGVTEKQMNSALKDLSEVYGAPIVRVDQAKAICNEEQYVTECAQIGKKHDLFSDERAKQVDTLLNELKGDVVEKLKKCDDIACLVDVANSIAGRLNSQNPTFAKAVELTPQKVKEKREIVDAAKTLGVDIEACRTMDPDTASIELLRGCARLAKHENVQKYIPQETKNRAEGADAAIALKESLASGKISCGDNTLEGCGNFCLSLSAEARAEGISAIPPVCRQIAQQFFGDDGTKELERAYTTVQETFNTLADKARSVVFTTIDGKTLTDPASIGRYMEEAGSRGDVEAVSNGMDFLVAKGFVTPKDREFALSMIRKVNERGPVDFDACQIDPSKCADLVSEEDRGQFTAMGEIEKVIKNEMSKHGVADPSLCSSDPSVGKSCLEAARAALPQIEKLASSLPQAQGIVSDIKQRIRFGEAGLEARSRVEEKFKTSSDFSMGNQRFGSISELDSFCRFNPQQCLSETAKEGIFSKDIAAERYEYAIDARYGPMPPGPAPQGQGDMRNVAPQFPPGFNKEEALQQFKKWLDNPESTPPMPSGANAAYPAPYATPYPAPYPVPYPQYQNQQYQGQQGQGQYPQDQYQKPPFGQRVCPFDTSMLSPCKSGEYRQESRNEFGCLMFGSCIPFDTKTEPPRTDSKNICPALPTIESCPAGEEKTVSFSSPECGTYYSCRAISKPPTDDQNRTTAGCEQRYGSGWHSMDSSGNCFNPLMTEYRTTNGALNSCAATPAYGCSSSSDVPPSTTPSGQREQVWNSSGLRSWVRTDADQARIELLKQACANVPSRANVWLPSAGTQSSSDFGMPDSGKCARAVSCSSEQYFDGSACVSSTQNTYPPSCGSNEYWNGSSCVSSTQTNTNTTTTGSCSSELIGLLGSGCHSMGSGWFNGEMTKYVTPGSQTVRNCTTEPVSGCSGGNYYNQTQTSCPSGQYWNGSSCVISTTQSYCPSGQYVNGACAYSSSATSCPSGQYWNGNSCVQTSTTDCTSGQYWNGSACVSSTQSTTGTYDTASAQQGCSNAGGTWDSVANYCRMPTSYVPPPSGTYTPPSDNSYTPPSSGSTYVPPTTESSPPPPAESPPPPPPTTTESAPISYIFCPDGHDWNGTYCTLSPLSPFERYTASVWSAFRSLLGL
ncbi:MAG: hypothetical protein AAB794_00630 [Patescibacteria group bacterium]